MERGWLVPYRTLALDLCPQSIGRAPRLPSAAGARLDPHDLSTRRRSRLRSYTGSANKTRSESTHICAIRWRNFDYASCPNAPIARGPRPVLLIGHPKEGQPTAEQWHASTTTAGTRRASRRPRPPARRRRRPPGRTPPGAAAATRRPKSGTTLRGVTIATGRPTGTRRARARPAPRAGHRREGPRLDRHEGRRRRTAPRHACRRWRSAARRERHRRRTRRPAPTSRASPGGPRRPGRRLHYMCRTSFRERRTASRARGPLCTKHQQHLLIPMPTWRMSFRTRGTTASRTSSGCWCGACRRIVEMCTETPSQ